jgi:transposase
MPIKYSKLSNYSVKKVLKCYCEDLNATQTAKICGVNRNIINLYYRVLREKIGLYQELINKGFKGEIELDESYFGGSGKGKGRRGRGTAKIPVSEYRREPMDKRVKIKYCININAVER